MTQLIKDINGVELYANRAVNDKDGNQIDNTYVKESELTDYAKKSEIPSIDGLMEESKLGYDDDGKIKSYDGTEFAGEGGSGGKTYTGVAPVVVDNDADEISVETAEVEYQQIVHDDSLVHVSNNAQYALGVNMNMFDWIDISDKCTITETDGILSLKYNPVLKLVMFNWQKESFSRTTTQKNILTITDSKYCPIVQNVAVSYYFSDNGIARVFVQQDGVIGCTASVAATKTARMNAVWICQGGN